MLNRLLVLKKDTVIDTRVLSHERFFVRCINFDGPFFYTVWLLLTNERLDRSTWVPMMGTFVKVISNE